MKKIVSIFAMSVAAAVSNAAPINADDWDFDYIMTQDVEYSGGTILFQGDVKSSVWFDKTKQSKLYDNGFSATLELPAGMTSSGSSFGSSYMNMDGFTTEAAITWSISFKGDKCDISIFDNNGAKVDNYIDINLPSGATSFDLTYALIKNADSSYTATIASAAMGFDYRLDGITLKKTADGMFHIDLEPDGFEMSKGNAKLTDFSCPPATVPEPAEWAAILGALALVAAWRKRR